MNAFFWFCLTIALGAIGALAAMVGVGISYLRGFQSGRLPLVCAVVAGLASLGLWLLVAFVEPSCSIVFGAATSLGAFMSFTYWLSQYERK